jgi:hypothetical protein
MSEITPDVVRNYKEFTPKFLCGLNANIYNIQFKRFKIRDMESDFVLFDVGDNSDINSKEENKVDEAKKEEEEKAKKEAEEKIMKEEEEDIYKSPRMIRYHLGPDFLDLKNLGSSLTFSVGDKPVKDFLMIERHYFNDTLIKSFEFKFDFCIPNSVNTWESIYTIPEIDPEVKKKMIAEPWHTKSDSFYFVGDKLIMHNKAIYNYAPLN